MEDVVKELQNEGFKNIKTINMQDVGLGLFNKVGAVESVSIDGRTDYHEGEYFNENAAIIIQYHGKKD